MEQTITFKELKETKDIKRLIALYSSTTLYHHSKVWMGKSYPVMLEISNEGLSLLYRSTAFFKGWTKTNVDENTKIELSIVSSFIEEAKAVARNFYSKVDFLSS